VRKKIKEINKMKIHKAYVIVGLIIAFSAFFEVAAHASESNQATTLSFSQPIQIPGQILPAGTYLFKLLNSDSERNMVQIFDSNQTHIYATLDTIPTDRPNPTGETVITLAEQGDGRPDALLKWYYPGTLTGNEFLYSSHTEKELAQDRQQTVVSHQQPTSDSETTGFGN
jgi:Protein of unknown function (DUF2911)